MISLRPLKASRPIAQVDRPEHAAELHNWLMQLPPEKQAAIEDCPEVMAILNDRTLNAAQRKTRLKPFLSKWREEIREDERGIADKKGRLAALEAIAPWARLTQHRLERNDCSRLHKLIEAHAAGKVIDEHGEALPREHAPWLTNAQPFVVQHDWAAAFANATDYADGDFTLPYQECAFEFRISGRTVIVVSFQADEAARAKFPEITVSTPSLPYVECPNGYWWCGGEAAQTSPTMIFAWAQIRAISIALDAEVATRDVVRASTALNERRRKDGKVPLYDFHVVALRGRQVRQHLPSAHGTHRSPRLHFRRGHWRHYEAHKTWVRWTLVGDPELGFIDKAYRL